MRVISRQRFLRYMLQGASLVALYPFVKYSYKKYFSKENSIRPYEKGAARSYHLWYRKNFFNFSDYLKSSEKTYVNLCLDITDDWANKINENLSLSTSSYSHRIQGEKINSSRMAHGSLKYQKNDSTLFVFRFKRF